MQDALHRAAQANTDLLATRDDRWYPTFHVAAPAGWINDPNDECLLDLLPMLDSLRFTSDVRRVLGLRGFGK